MDPSCGGGWVTAPSIPSVAISHPSLHWRLAFPRQSALLSNVTPQEGCEETKLSLRTWRGKKAWKWRLLHARCDGPYSRCLIPVLSATEGWAQSLFRASAFP